MVVLLFLAACGPKQTYPGPALPNDKVAVIIGSTALGGVRVYFAGEEQDGEDFTARRIEVPAGEQTVRVRYYDTSRGPGSALLRNITFHAEGGHAYRLKAVQHGGVWIWIEDTKTGRVVGGKKP